MSLFFLINIKSILAYLDPKGLSPEPYNTGINTLPITNLAKFLVEIDDNYSQFKLFTATLGRAEAVHIGEFSYNDTVKIINIIKGKDHIDWIPWNEFEGIEFNNYNEYLKASCNEFFNMEEWYQPTRILLDFGSISHNDTTKGWQKKYFNLTENKNIKLPFLCLGLSRGLSSQNNIYLDYKKKIISTDFTIIMVNDITHLDGDTISDNQGSPIVADIIYNWLNNKKIFYYNN